jgi:hypothetical protein
VELGIAEGRSVSEIKSLGIGGGGGEDRVELCVNGAVLKDLDNTCHAILLDPLWRGESAGGSVESQTRSSTL